MSGRWRGLAVIAAVLIGAMSLSSGAVGAGPAGRLQDSDALAAGIHAGSCARPTEEQAFPLAEVVKPTGGSVRGGPPLASESSVGTSLAALQSVKHAVIIYRGTPEADRALACGDIHTATSPDGSTVVVGLAERNNSLYTGIAVLTATGEQTSIRVYVARGLAGALRTRSNDDDSDADMSVVVTITETGIELSEAQILADQTVEFRVTNETDVPHEAMLEALGANEEPLMTGDATQAETEDIPAGESAIFVYTFEEPGDFQIADHIGYNYESGFVSYLTVLSA